MGKKYYGTITALAWALGHYFYGCKHFVFLASEYFPYRLKNPKSSNPHLTYQDIYQPWKDQDDYDKVTNQLRLGTTAGVIKKQAEGLIDNQTADRLKRICEEIDMVFLYPVVCRVDISRFEVKRLQIAGSGLSGSSECVISDLQEMEIDELLFLDFDTDTDFKNVIYDEYHEYREKKGYNVDPAEALEILERRCNRGGIRQPVSNSNP